MAITITSTAKSASLQTLFSKCNHVYFEEIVSGSGLTQSAITTGVDFDIELPVLEDSLSLNMGDIEKTEIKLIDGTIWTSKATKGDSSITMQVSSMSKNIVKLYMTEGTTISDAQIAGQNFTGQGYKLDVKKSLGAIMLTDDTESVVIILPNVEMAGSLNVGDGDNPSYFNVTLTPKPNSDGDAVLVYIKKNA